MPVLELVILLCLLLSSWDYKREVVYMVEKLLFLMNSGGQKEVLLTRKSHVPILKDWTNAWRKGPSHPPGLALCPATHLAPRAHWLYLLLESCIWMVEVLGSLRKYRPDFAYWLCHFSESLGKQWSEP